MVILVYQEDVGKKNENENIERSDVVVFLRKEWIIYFQGGITEEQMLMLMGANTHLSPLQAKMLLEVTCSPAFMNFKRPFDRFGLMILLHIYNISGRGGWFCLCQSTGSSALFVSISKQ